MNYLFDCSQIVVVRNAKAHSKRGLVCKSLSKIWRGKVLHGEQIDPAKIKYVELFCESSIEIFEFDDKEFQGEFEDWQIAELVPERIVQFEECIKKLVDYGYDIERVFIIQTPSVHPDRVYETNIEPLSKALYCKSLFYTEEGAGCETLIINFK